MAEDTPTPPPDPSPPEPPESSVPKEPPSGQPADVPGPPPPPVDSVAEPGGTVSDGASEGGTSGGDSGGGGPAGSGSPGGPVSENRTLMLVLSYLGPLALVPYLTEKSDREVMWHSRNGLVFLGVDILAGIISSVSFAVLNCFGCIVAPGLLLILAGLHGVGLYRALNGRRLEVPGLVQFVDML